MLVVGSEVPNLLEPDAASTLVISQDLHDADQLRTGGFHIESVGHAIEPPKVIVFAPAQRVARLVSANEVPVSLGGELLSAEYLVLVPFDALRSR